MIIRELVEAERGKVAAFLLALDERNRCLRFCRPMTDEAIRSHVERINWDEAIVLGAFDQEANLVGLIELREQGASADLAVTVAPDHRRNGIGHGLMDRALFKARVLGKERVTLTCQADNKPMRRLAQRVGLVSQSESGVEDSPRAPAAREGAAADAARPVASVTYTAALYARTWENVLQKLLSTPWSMAADADLLVEEAPANPEA
ncbi:MAG TPA: GNAT family N-acetyltransferase [Burkholderiales bacterium]|nr:GNAT family N-acetyltransferase [Burkholderiales bacterium]